MTKKARSKKKTPDSRMPKLEVEPAPNVLSADAPEWHPANATQSVANDDNVAQTTSVSEDASSQDAFEGGSGETPALSTGGQCAVQDQSLSLSSNDDTIPQEEQNSPTWAAVVARNVHEDTGNGYLSSGQPDGVDENGGVVTSASTSVSSQADVTKASVLTEASAPVADQALELHGTAEEQAENSGNDASVNREAEGGDEAAREVRPDQSRTSGEEQVKGMVSEFLHEDDAANITSTTTSDSNDKQLSPHVRVKAPRENVAQPSSKPASHEEVERVLDGVRAANEEIMFKTTEDGRDALPPARDVEDDPNSCADQKIEVPAISSDDMNAATHSVARSQGIEDNKPAEAHTSGRDFFISGTKLTDSSRLFGSGTMKDTADKGGSCPSDKSKGQVDIDNLGRDCWDSLSNAASDLKDANAGVCDKEDEGRGGRYLSLAAKWKWGILAAVGTVLVISVRRRGRG